MEVILIENIEKLGKVGDVVKVKAGYARNYLIPKKKVLRANKENLKIFEEKKSLIEAEEKKRKDKAEEFLKKIKGAEIIIVRNASENGQLYGSVTSKDIIKEILLLYQIEFTNEQINIKKPFKSIGIYEIEIFVYTDIKTSILISVAKTKESGQEQINKFKKPKVTKDKKVKDEKITSNEAINDLDTKDLLNEIEKKDKVEEKTPQKNKKSVSKEKKPKKIVKKEKIKKKTRSKPKIVEKKNKEKKKQTKKKK